MDHWNDMTLDLPLELIREHPGFSIDSGGSVGKLTYVDKRDYESATSDGKDPKTVPVRLTNFSSYNFDACVEFLQENCRLHRQGDNKPKVSCTGIHGAANKDKLEKIFNVEVTVQPEFECFVSCFHYLLKECSHDQLFYTSDPEFLAHVEKDRENLTNLWDNIGTHSKWKGEEDESNVDVDPDEQPMFPCMLAMLGSAFGFYQLNEDRTFNIADGLLNGGRMFFGLSCMLTGAKTFHDVIAQVERGKHWKVDMTVSDIGDAAKDSGENMYSVFDTGHVDRNVIFPFGKTVEESPDSFDKADMQASLVKTMAHELATVGTLAAQLNGIHKIYFCGSYCQPKAIRMEIVRAMELRRSFQAINPRIKRITYEFLRVGSHLGSIGAFIWEAQKK